MNSKVKKIFTNVRVIVLLAFIILSILSISPSFDRTPRLAVRDVVEESAADRAGMGPPAEGTLPRGRDILLSINNEQIYTILDYQNAVSDFTVNQTVLVETKNGRFPYRLRTLPIINQSIVGYETELVNMTNATTNETYQVEENVSLVDGSVLGVEDLGLALYTAPQSNIRLGLDLVGGVRVMLQPETEVSEADMSLVLESLEQRLNVYGLSDILVRQANDLEGNKFIIVEVPGADETEVRGLIGEQGKFEARIGDDISFTGGDDVRHVCRTADCSGLDPNRPCSRTEDGSWVCAFRFAITLSNEAAARQAAITENLEVIFEGNSEYLSEDLDLYLDDELVDTLKIGAELKGQTSTDISISGSGAGGSQEAAVADALENMQKLQTLLITGSLPVKLDFVKTDSISPVLGAEFIDNAITVGLLAIAAVILVVFLRYRKLKIVVPLALTMIAEVIIILGFAALSKWNLDLAGIAGIIIVAGTSVDHLIIITDSAMKKRKIQISWAERIKESISVITIALLTTCAAMLPLIWSGAGLLKGFAIVTIVGVLAGVLLARPAYANIIKILLKE
jgi:preprotein translocase subunit SecD